MVDIAKCVSEVPEKNKAKITEFLKERETWDMSPQWTAWAIHMELCPKCRTVRKKENMRKQATEVISLCCEIGQPLFQSALDDPKYTKKEK